ncbi:MAG: hypothetical protein L6Q98_08400 [Anaerolineae bacterium]|nr:hypothetical protein [Anaerolineae bacterium]NUQ02609.1 hypothetical protein [Anaerolineae bacterium]
MPTSYILKAARPRFAQARVNLAFRRAWYADAPDAQTPPADKPADAGSDDWRMEDLPLSVQKHIRELRAEAAERRKALERQQSEAAQREQQRLAEQGQFKELADQRGRELESFKPYKTRAEELEAIIRKGNETRIQQVREDMRALIPTDYAPERLAAWLDANMPRLSARPAPSLDAGAGTGSSAESLSDAERQSAAKMGMTPEQYLAAKKKAGL